MVETVSYDELDRMFYERLRLLVVAMGLLPDITLFTNNTDWQAARRSLAIALEGQGKRLVDVLGVGSWDDRDEKTDCRIVINRTVTTAGNIGGYNASYHDPYTEGGKDLFKKYQYPDSSDNVGYEVRIMTNQIAMDRILSYIIDKALGRRRYVKTVDGSGNFTNKNVLLINTGSADMSDYRYLERVYRYVLEDVFLQEPDLLATGIVPLSTVHFSVYLSDDSETDLVIPIPVATPSPLSYFPYIGGPFTNMPIGH